LDSHTDTRIARVEGFQAGQWAAQLLEELRASREDRAALREQIRQLTEEVAALRAERATQPPEATPTAQEPATLPRETQWTQAGTEKQPLSRAPLWLRFFGIRWRW
jgi:uncharacterized coiled-coil DUF342 family protein